MKKLSLYREKLNRLEGLKQEIEKLEGSAALKSDIDFIKDIEKALKKHRRQPSDLVVAFPEIKGGVKSSPAKRRKKRSSSPTRTFKHPKTGEVIKAKRTNNKTLKGWAEELGVTPDQLEVK
jgi:hypothetical protein